MSTDGRSVDVRLRLLGAATFARAAREAGAAVSGIGAKAKAASGDLSKTVNRLVAFQGANRVLSGAVGGIRSSIQAASDLNEQVNQTTVVFGEASGGVQKFAAGAARALGLSRVQALQAAGTFGALFVNLGKTQGQAANMSQTMVGLSSDLASFYNTSGADALDALRSGLAGETEPLRRYGVFLQDATLRQEAMALGLTNTTSKVLTPAQRTFAAYAVIMKQTSLAQGDFARTATGLANSQRTVQAETADTSAALGAALMPAMKSVTQILIGMAPLFAAMARHGTIVRIVVLSLVIAWVALNVAMTIFTILAAGLSLTVVGVIIIAIVALAAVIVLLAEHWDAVTAAVGGFWDTLRGAWGSIVGAFHSVVDAAGSFIDLILRNWPYLLAMIPGIGAPLALIITHFDDVRAGAHTLWVGITTVFGAIVRFVRWAAREISHAVGTITGPLSTVSDAIGGGFGAVGSLVGAAAGGTVTSPGAVLVGEKGPEVVYLPQRASVVPLDRAHGGGGTTEIVVPLYLDGREVTRAVAKHTADARARQ